MKKKNNWVLSLLLGIGLFNIDVVAFADNPLAQSILERIMNEKPIIENGKVVLPDSPDKKYRVVIGGSSNESVITTEGIVYSPLETMDVHLLYKVINKRNKADVAMSSDKDVVVTVSGKFTQEFEDNAKPNVVPGIREWKGKSGKAVLSDYSRIVIEDASLLKTGEQIKYYFQKMLDRPIEVSIGIPTTGDFYFSISDRKDLGKEGYSIDIDDIVSVEANTLLGALYAGVTLTQILSQDPEFDELPKGYIRDYPSYEVRGCMLDVARFYMPLDYLEEVTKYMAYFKINQIQVHINDDGGEQNESFRVESKKFPAINTGLNPNEVYGQEAYRQYQKNMVSFGVDVITEIDTPAHCRFVRLYNPSFMLDDSHIDLKNEDAVAFMQQLYNEFLDGENPVFQSENFHIGADEYHRDPVHGEDFMKYLNKMIKYINDKGLQPRMWASLGGGGLNGKTPVNPDVISNYWAYSWADFPKMIADGFKCVNTSTDIYVVPGLTTAYADYLDLKSIYETWDATILSGGFTKLSEAHPLLLGCQSAIWYDRKVGMSEFDYFDRLKDQIMLISEKGWYGRKRQGQTGENFLARINSFVHSVPGVNPSRKVFSKTDVVASYGFNINEDALVKDGSGNGYHAVLDGVDNADGVLKLNGKGSLHLPFKEIGFPYTVSMDLFMDSTTLEKAILFDGKAGRLYLNFDGKGNIGYERKGYQYLLEYKVKPGKWQNIKFCCDNRTMNLYIDGVLVAKARYVEDAATVPDSSTFVLPTETIGSGLVGKIDNLSIYNKLF